MSAAILLHRPGGGPVIPSQRYGSFELKAAFRRHMAMAVLASAIVTTLILALAFSLGTAVHLHPAFPPVVDGPRVYVHFFPAPEPPQNHLTPTLPKLAADGRIVAVPDHTDTPDIPPGPTAIDPPNIVGTDPSLVQNGHPKPSPRDPTPWEGPTSGTRPDVEPVLLTRVTPAYPEIARQASVEGPVVLRAQVLEDGSVGEVVVEEGMPLLNGAAVQAVRRFRFRPALVAGRPVTVWVQVPLRFRLSDLDR